MRYLVPLYKWERGYHMADESLIVLHFDPVYTQEEIPWITRLLARLLNLLTRS